MIIYSYERGLCKYERGLHHMNSYSTTLLRFAALFALLGAFLGSHMAGSGNLNFQSIHAHILVVGWLSLFAWAVYYKVFRMKKTLLATLHVWTAIIGSIGLTFGMWVYKLNPFNFPEPLPLILFIVGGTVLLISFFIFLLLTFMKPEEDVA